MFFLLIDSLLHAISGFGVFQAPAFFQTSNIDKTILFKGSHSLRYRVFLLLEVGPTVFTSGKAGRSLFCKHYLGVGHLVNGCASSCASDCVSSNGCVSNSDCVSGCAILKCD